MDDFLIGSFMEVTGCAAPEDAAYHLHSCSWNLEEAVSLFFSIGAGTSGSSPSPLPSSPAQEDAVAPSSGPSRSGSRWDSETRVVSNSSSRRRNMNSRRRRRERFREEEERNRQRRRVEADQFLNTNNKSSAKAKAEEEEDSEKMLSPPEELTFKGGFHGAMAHAARRARWLLVNVQDTGDHAFATYTQNLHVWSSELMAQYVRDHFVLWRVDADAQEVARKVCCYYKLQPEKLPAVVVVDPVTGQAMATLYGTSTDPNDLLVAVRPYLMSKPVLPATTTNTAASSSSSAHAEPVVQEPTITTTTTSQHQQEAKTPPPALVEKQQDNKAVATAVAVEPAPPVPAPATPPSASAALLGKVCKLRVRLPGGRVLTKEFSGGSAVAALFAYCRSELGDAGKKPFRLMRLVDSTRDEIADPSVSFDDSGLHLSTVSVLLG